MTKRTRIPQLDGVIILTIYLSKPQFRRSWDDFRASNHCVVKHTRADNSLYKVTSPEIVQNWSLSQVLYRLASASLQSQQKLIQIYPKCVCDPLSIMKYRLCKMVNTYSVFQTVSAMSCASLNPVLGRSGQ